MLSVGSGRYLSRWAAGAEHGVKVFDEDLREDVDGSQSAERDRTVTRPNQVHPENTGQVGRTHLVDDALLGHLTATNHTAPSVNHQQHEVNKQFPTSF